MGRVQEVLGAIWVILTSKWFWIIVSIALLILLVPLVGLLILLMLPFPYNTLGLIFIIVGWGVAAGYKDWILSKAKEERRKRIKP